MKEKHRAEYTIRGGINNIEREREREREREKERERDRDDH